MKSIVFEISFFEAFFKCHYTKKYRLSYPAPLPTSIAGILGSILGKKRFELKEYFKGFYMGALFVDGTYQIENVTLIEMSSKGRERAVEKVSILSEPKYKIAVYGEDEKVEEIKRKLEKYDLYFLPFGGQNDYFIKEIKLLGEGLVESKNEAQGYFPRDIVDSIVIEKEKEGITKEGEKEEKEKNSKNIRLWTFPVKYKRIKKDFIFLDEKGKAKLKEKILTVSDGINDIAVYKLDDFILL